MASLFSLASHTPCDLSCSDLWGARDGLPTAASHARVCVEASAANTLRSGVAPHSSLGSMGSLVSGAVSTMSFSTISTSQNPSQSLRATCVPSRHSSSATNALASNRNYILDERSNTMRVSDTGFDSVEEDLRAGLRMSGNGSAMRFSSSSLVNKGMLVDDVEDDEDEDELDYEDDDDDASGEVVHVDITKEQDKDENLVKNLGLMAAIEEGLLKKGIERLFPIQKAVLAPSMEGRDIIARAKTGTGKTLAFGIPIMQRILEEIEQNGGRRASRGPRCIVLAPTRELAKQVERELMETVPRLATVCVYGGVSIEGQMRQIRQGVDVVVGTPGRMIDLIQRRTLGLSDVKFVVLDEADQMLAVGFEEDVEQILEGLPEQRQTSLFSATMPGWVKKLSKKYLRTPLTIDLVGEKDDKLAENIRLLSVKTPNTVKQAILVDLITVHGRGAKTIVFTQTKRDADAVAETLGRSIGCEALHGDIAQAQRERTLQAFREARFPVLVATDVAARGLDIPNVDLVIHYEIPNDPETFVHRSGRTGRAGKSGSTILMYTQPQMRTLRLIERDVGCKFETVPVPSLEQVLGASAERVAEVIDRVHPELADVFVGTAERLIQEKGTLALAAAIAHISGYTKPPVSRSLITHQEGYTTVRMVRSPRSRGPRLSTPRNVLGALGELHRAAADNVGKIKMLVSDKEEGAVFDLPDSIAKELLRLQSDSGDLFDIPKELPPIEDDTDRAKDMYGRGMGSRDRGGSGGERGRDSRGRAGPRSSFGSSSRGSFEGGDRRSFSMRERDGGRGRPPSRSSDWSDSRGAMGRPVRSTRPSSFHTESWAENNSFADDGNDDWSRAEPRRESRGSGRSFGGGGSREGGFSGVCFLCKQPGHRAADCPVVTGR